MGHESLEVKEEERGERTRRGKGVRGREGEVTAEWEEQRKVWKKIRKEMGQSRVALAVSSHHC